MTVTANGTRYNDRAARVEPIKTFDDIEKYTYVRYRGKPGWILDKGTHLSQTKGSHIQIQMEEPIHPNSDKMECVVVERLVNKYLREKKTLWVDWTDIGRDKQARIDA